MATQTITPTIVNVNTQVQTAPEASQLQQSGLIVSAGGTTLTIGTAQYYGNLAQAQGDLVQPVAIESIAWASGTVTVTAGSAIGGQTGDTFLVTISGTSPSGYDGTFVGTIASADTFTYPLTQNPGTETVPGTFTPPGLAFVTQALTAFFAQGTGIGVNVGEVGGNGNAAAITQLGSLIANQQPQSIYAYLLPPEWDTGNSAAVVSLANDYASPTGQTYFFVTTTATNLSAYAGIKSVFATVANPSAPASEIPAAAPFYQWLQNQPGPASSLAPMAYRYAYGVTPWEQIGNGPTITNVLSASGNLILTGAEGGLSESILFKGTTMDGEQAAFWYGVDYFRIQVKQAIAAAIIQGSNSQPPLLYDQNGINTLLAIAERVAANAVAYGCAEAVSVTATPFATYIAANPTDYANGIYNGLSATLTGQSGFLTITFQLDATAF